LARRANLASHGVQSITKDLLMAPARVTVNVANSAQDPTVRLELFTYAMRQYAEVRANMPPDMDPEPIKAYIFGLLGFRDASRFSIDTENEDPRIGQLEQQLQQMADALESKMMEIEAKNETKYAEIESKENIKMLEVEQKERDTEIRALVEGMNAQTQLLIASMREDMAANNKNISMETRELLNTLQNSTQQMIGSMGGVVVDASGNQFDKNIGNALQEVLVMFQQIAQSTDQNSQMIQASMQELQRHGEEMARMVEIMNSERENEIIERDNEGVPIKTRSRIIKK